MYDGVEDNLVVELKGWSEILGTILSRPHYPASSREGSSTRPALFSIVFFLQTE